jgi:tellurite resistance protein
MGFLGNLLGRATGARDAVAAALEDFRLDNARKDDAELGAYVLVSMGYSDGAYGEQEQGITVAALSAMFRNFEPPQITAFIRAADEAHRGLPSLGYLETETKLRAFKDDAGSLRKIFTAAVELAKLGGLDPAEANLLRRFLAVRSDIRPSEVGL